MDIQSYIDLYLKQTADIANWIDKNAIGKMIRILDEARRNAGRLFILGVGGSAANASHAVNDFRKIAGIESYAPTDNSSELTARVNDDGWEGVFSSWLMTSRLSEKDVILVLSVGGGNTEKNISPNIVKALRFARERKAKIIGIVGRDGGFTAQVADACVIVPVCSIDTVTPHTEAFQAVVCHLIVSHPLLRASAMKWESTE